MDKEWKKKTELSLDMLGQISGGEIEASEYPIIDSYIQWFKGDGKTLEESICTVDREDVVEYIRQNWDRL